MVFTGVGVIFTARAPRTPHDQTQEYDYSKGIPSGTVTSSGMCLCDCSLCKLNVCVVCHVCVRLSGKLLACEAEESIEVSNGIAIATC